MEWTNWLSLVGPALMALIAFFLRGTFKEHKQLVKDHDELKLEFTKVTGKLHSKIDNHVTEVKGKLEGVEKDLENFAKLSEVHFSNFKTHLEHIESTTKRTDRFIQKTIFGFKDDEKN